jgi:hypothetical protein
MSRTDGVLPKQVRQVMDNAPSDVAKMARRPARTNAAGELIALAEQDRTLRDRALVAEGVGLLNRAMGRGAVSEYQLQAAITAIHDQASRAGHRLATDPCLVRAVGAAGDAEAALHRRDGGRRSP